MSAERKRLPKETGHYAWREIGAINYAGLARVYRDITGVLMVHFYEDRTTAKLKDCAKRWWLRLPENNLGK